MNVLNLFSQIDFFYYHMDGYHFILHTGTGVQLLNEMVE